MLQSRPITVGAPLASDDDGFETSASPDDVYTPEGVGEMLPGVIPPLVWSINHPMLDAAFRSLLSEFGSTTPLRSRPVVGRFRGRAAVNLSVLRDAADTMPAVARVAEPIDADVAPFSIPQRAARARRVYVGERM